MTEDEEVTLSYVVTVTTGRCCICATTAMHWPDMENPVPRTAVFGKDGEDKIIEVPCGTAVYNAETGEYIC